MAVHAAVGQQSGSAAARLSASRSPAARQRGVGGSSPVSIATSMRVAYLIYDASGLMMRPTSDRPYPAGGPTARPEASMRVAPGRR